jgi:D-lactate dehydrogenase (cytochrome)
MTAIDEIKEAVGPKGYTEDIRVMAPYLADWRGNYSGAAAIVVLPKSTAEVSAVVKICAAAGIAMVPQGGNTGLVRGGVPTEAGDQIVINLSRMNKVLEVDALSFTLKTESGATLQSIQEAAKEADRLFPLSLAAEGSCQIGGNIGTNAGGIHVLRYGNTRDLVLGLEVVLPDGQIWNGQTALRKDNTGYDLKQLFIGAEGTLGIVTGAVLKLFPAPKAIETAFIGCASAEAALAMLARFREVRGDHLTAFEIFPRQGLELVLKNIPGTRDPLAEAHPWYAVVEFWAANADEPLKDAMEAILAELMDGGPDGGFCSDAAIPATIEQRNAIWKLRESFAEALRAEGAGFAFDVSVPVARIPEFIAKADAAVEALLPGAITVGFGHAGDGNIHYNLGPPPGMALEELVKLAGALSRAVHDIVVDLNGSISAEHGIGRQRAAELAHYKDEMSLAMMRSIKAGLDPENLMNPGVIL